VLKQSGTEPLLRNALTRVIAQLRKALGDDAKQRVTSNGADVGYRFLAQVQIKEALPTPPGTGLAPTTRCRSISREITGGSDRWPERDHSRLPDPIHQRGRRRTPVLKPVNLQRHRGGPCTAFSPDGSNLAYASDRGIPSDFRKAGSAGGREIRLPATASRTCSRVVTDAPISFMRASAMGIFVIPALAWKPAPAQHFRLSTAWSPTAGRSFPFRRDHLDRIPEILPATPSTLWIVVAEGARRNSCRRRHRL